MTLELREGCLRLKKEMNLRTDNDARWLRWCLLASLAITTLGLSLLGLMLRPSATLIPPKPHQPFLIALRLALPMPKPPKPLPRPVARKQPPHVLPVHRRIRVRRATLRAASAHRNQHPILHKTPQVEPGGSVSSDPTLVTLPAPPVTTPKPPAQQPVLVSSHSPLQVAVVPPAPFDAPTMPVSANGIDSGSKSSGVGQGTSSGTGRGTGEGQGAGGGSNGPFGLGSGGTGNGEGQRHIVYVLDISGSMTSRIDRARQELHDALAGLQTGETFNIIAFSTDVRPFSDGMNPATPTMIARADYYLSTLQVTGGTNIEGALMQTLRMPDVNVVFVITDGVPTDDSDGNGIDDTKKYMAAFPHRVREWNVNNARIYTVGLVGKDPDGRDESFEAAGMLQQISRDSGGVSKIVTVGVATPQ